MADWLLYEHEDGRFAVAPTSEAATFAHGNPAWHRVGPVAVHAPATVPLGSVRERAANAFTRAVNDGQLWEYEGFMSGYEACWLDEVSPTALVTSSPEEIGKALRFYLDNPDAAMNDYRKRSEWKSR